MAADGVRNASTYPSPPPFYHLYGSEEGEQSSNLDIWTPPPSLDESFVKFGAVQSNDFLVHDLGPDVPKLYEEIQRGESTHIDYSYDLRRLVRQVGDLYISLLESLVDSPTSIRPYVVQLSHTFTNITHLLNTLRRHQAIQTVIQMLCSQIENTKIKTKRLHQGVERTKEFLRSRGVEFEGNLTVDQSITAMQVDMGAEPTTCSQGTFSQSRGRPDVLHVRKELPEDARDATPDTRLASAQSLLEEIDDLEC